MHHTMAISNNAIPILVIFCYFITVIQCRKEYVYVDELWCPAEYNSWNDTVVRPFNVVFSDEMINDLRYRLTHHRPSRPTLPQVGFGYGFNTRELPKWIDYWVNEYPFKAREEYLNQMPQFKTKIQGLDMHFIWVAPQVPRGVEVVPLLLLHGWPGSIREFYDVIPLLTSISKGRNFVFEVVAPSLPGFAFSDAACRPGLNSARMAVVLRNLMHRLGHKKFYVQGGDWGALIGADLATLFQKEVLGYHTNLGLSGATKGLLIQAAGAIFPPFVVSPALAHRMYPLLEKLLGLLKESGYLHLQATKPDTLGVGLSDSPAGLLAYILQIFSTAARFENDMLEDGGLNHYSREALIDNLMLYWSSNAITTSMRIYTETINKSFSIRLLNTPTKVPTWVIQAPYEIIYQSPIILKTKFPNLLHATVLSRGGHFLALERPIVFSQDLFDAVGAFRRWHRGH